MEKNKPQNILLNSAAVGGLYLGLYFACKYIIYMYMIDYVGLSILYGLSILGVPVIVYFLIKNFRGKLTKESPFPLKLSWLYGMLIYIFASIISMPLHYYYYKVRLPIVIPYIKDVISQISSTLKNFDSSMMDNIIQALDNLGSTPVFQLVFSDFSNNMIYGAIVSLVVGLILKRK